MKKDDKIRNFLIEKKADIAKIIEHNLKSLKTFPDDHSLIEYLTAEEKVEKIEQSLRNPQLKILAQFVKNRRVSARSPSSLSPLSRRRLLE